MLNGACWGFLSKSSLNIFCLFNPQWLQTIDKQKLHERVQISLWLSPFPPFLEKSHLYHETVVTFNWFGSKVYLCWLLTAFFFFFFQIWIENGSAWCKLCTEVMQFLFLKRKTATEIYDDMSVTSDEKRPAHSTVNIKTLSILKYRNCKISSFWHKQTVEDFVLRCKEVYNIKYFDIQKLYNIKCSSVELHNTLARLWSTEVWFSGRKINVWNSMEIHNHALIKY